MHCQVKSTLADLEVIQQQISSPSGDNDLFKKERVTDMKLQQVLHYEVEFWHEKSRVSWHLHGDRNAEFFTGWLKSSC